MISERVIGRRVRMGVAAVATLALTSACAAGQIAQTANQQSTIDAVNRTVGSIALRGLALAAPTTAPYYPAGSAVQLVVVFTNQGAKDDTLTSITTSSAAGWAVYANPDDAKTVQAAAASAAAESSATAASSAPAPLPSASAAALPQGTQKVVVPAGGRVGFGVPSATGALLLLNTKDRLYPGNPVRMTFTFANAGAITIPVPVQLTGNPGTAVVGGSATPEG